MPKKSSIYIKDWTSRLLGEENLTLNNDLIDALVKNEFLPVAWENLESSFLSFYNSDPGSYDIRSLLTAAADVVTMPDYYTQPHLSELEEAQALRLIGDFLIGSDWSETYEYDLSGDYDPEKYQRWLSGLADCYNIAVREIDFYNEYKPKLESVGLKYSSNSGFRIQEEDVCKYELYQKKEQEIRTLIDAHVPPYDYLKIIIDNWAFYRRFERKLQPQIEFCILCSSKPMWSAHMVCRLRRYMTHLSQKYMLQDK